MKLVRLYQEYRGCQLRVSVTKIKTPDAGLGFYVIQLIGKSFVS